MTGRLTSMFPSRAATVVVVVSVTVLCGIGVNTSQVPCRRLQRWVTYIVPTRDTQYGLASAAWLESCRKQLSW